MRYFKYLSFWYMLKILPPLRLGIVLFVLWGNVLISLSDFVPQIPEIEAFILMDRLTAGLLATH